MRTIGERIRDKIAASKKKEMWMGGVPPLGYRAQDRKLIVVDSDAESYAPFSVAMPISARCGCCTKSSKLAASQAGR